MLLTKEADIIIIITLTSTGDFGRGFNTAIRASKINNRVLPSIIFPISVTSRVISISHNRTERTIGVFHAEIIIIIIIIIIIVVIIIIIIIRSLKQRHKYFKTKPIFLRSTEMKRKLFGFILYIFYI